MSALKRVSRQIRYRLFFWSAINSGANTLNSSPIRAMARRIGPLTWDSYSSAWARNHSRSLWRASARRKVSVFALNGDAAVTCRSSVVLYGIIR